VAECGEIHCIINNRINYEKYAGVGFLSAPAVYMVYSFALSQFFYFVDVPSPQHCKSLALVLHCFRFQEHCIAIAAKTPPALFYRSYRCYIYVTPLGAGEELPQCCLPLLVLRSLKTLRALNLGKNKRAVMCVEIADSRPPQRSPFRIACALRLPR